MNRLILNTKIHSKNHQKSFDAEISKACAAHNITENQLREFALDTPLAPVVKYSLYVAFAVFLMTYADSNHEAAYWVWSVAMISVLGWRFHALKASFIFFKDKGNRQTYKRVIAALKALQKAMKPINKAEKQQARQREVEHQKSRSVVMEKRIKESKRVEAMQAFSARSPGRVEPTIDKPSYDDPIVSELPRSSLYGHGGSSSTSSYGSSSCSGFDSSSGGDSGSCGGGGD